MSSNNPYDGAKYPSLTKSRVEKYEMARDPEVSLKGYATNAETLNIKFHVEFL